MAENLNDAVPAIGYAITALKRSKGDQKSPYWKNYTDAIAHFTQVHGAEAGKQLQDIAYNTAMKGGDISSEITRFSKNAIDSKRTFHPTIQNMLAMAYEGQKPIEKFQYGFDLPSVTPAAAATASLPEKLATLFKK